MKKTRRNSRVGRPRSPQKAALAEALALRQDSAARRQLRRIAELRRAHLPAVEVSACWEQERRRVAVRLTAVPGELTPAIVEAAGDVGQIEQIVKQGAYELLRDLAGGDELADRGPRSSRGRAIRPSTCLSSARARGARLQSELLDVREQIARGELRPVAEVEYEWSARVTAVRSTVLMWPTSLADALGRAATLSGAQGVHVVLLEAVQTAIAELRIETTRTRRVRKAS